MRNWLTWLLVLGAIVGLGCRVLGLEHRHDRDGGMHVTCSHGADHDSSHGHDHDGEDEGHDGDCPSWPHDHHRHACCVVYPLTIEEPRFEVDCRLFERRIELVRHMEQVPEGPVSSLDKPPLI